MTTALPDEVPSLQLRDGRRLAWQEAGDPAGRAVFAFHGLPGSREQRHPDERIARSAGARMIHVDRPGFGLSDPAPQRRLRDWAGDVVQLADYLRLDRFAVAGVSGGGPFATACAALLPGRVSRLALVSSVGPPGSMHGQPRMHGVVRTAFALALRVPWMLAPPMALAATLAVSQPERYVALLARQMAARDRAILLQPAVRAMLARDVREAFRQGTNGFIRDLSLLANPWDFALGEIRAECGIWHGGADRMIPPSASERLAGAIHGSRLCLLPNEGHFLIFDRWKQILAWVAEG
jgi:pimeloyl-ACP methyl ester carboxylesterase